MNGLQRLRQIRRLGASCSSRTTRRQSCCIPMATSVTSQLTMAHRNQTEICKLSQSLTCRTRSLSSITKGQDLLEDSLEHGSQRKIILDSYGPSGFDVKGMIRIGDEPTNDEQPGDDAIIHMNGSIVAFPQACFLWNITRPGDITLESLSVVKLYKPTVEYLFIGCDSPMPKMELDRIKKEFGSGENHVIVEQMDVMNAMGTFNILNGEDRRVACVLVLEPEGK